MTPPVLVLPNNCVIESRPEPVYDGDIIGWRVHGFMGTPYFFPACNGWSEHHYAAMKQRADEAEMTGRVPSELMNKAPTVAAQKKVATAKAALKWLANKGGKQ